MRQAMHYLQARTSGQNLYDVTASISGWVRAQDMARGLLTIWCRHTSASLIVQENADPDVRADLIDFLRRLVPENAGYRHTTEGPDDMPAHIKSVLTQTSLSIPCDNHQLVLGTWQAIYLFEHRTAPQTRTLVLHMLGE